MLVYMLEDDQVIRNLVLYALRQQTDLEAEGFERPSAFYSAVRSRVPDLILLDVMLPEEDGLTVNPPIRYSRGWSSSPFSWAVRESRRSQALTRESSSIISKGLGM